MVRLVALSGVVVISFAAILVRVADVSPSTAAFYRGAYALPVLAALFVAVRKRDTRPPKLRWLAVLSGVFLAADLALWHRAIALIGAGLGTVLANTQVIFVAVLAWVIHRERPTWLAAICVPVVLAGAVLTSGLGDADAYGRDPVLGVVLGTLAGLLYSGYLLIFRASNRVLVSTAGPLLDATFGLTAGSLLFGAWDGAFDLAPAWPEHGFLLLLALGPQVVGWFLIAIALPRLAALETSVLLLAQPLLAMVWGWVLLDEVLSPVQLAGALFVLTGIALLQLGTTRAVSLPEASGAQR